MIIEKVFQLAMQACKETWNEKTCAEIIKALEQEPTDDATLKDIFCMGCEYREQEPCGDCISRQAVMDALCDGCELFKNGEQTCFSKCEEYHYLATLPPVIAEPKTGHWIIKSETSAVCSRCHKHNLFYGDFCKWCGAKMVEPKERSK